MLMNQYEALFRALLILKEILELFERGHDSS